MRTGTEYRLSVGLLFLLLQGCATTPLKPTTLGSYSTTSKIVIDGKRDAEEWKEAKRQSYIEYQVDKKSYYRHYVWCLHDRDSLYLAVETFWTSAFPAKRILFPEYEANAFPAKTVLPGGEAVDTFPLQLFSEGKKMVDKLVASDGSAYGEDLSCAATQRYVRVQSGTAIEAAAQVDNDPRRGKDHMVWWSEVRMPLQELQPLGNTIWLIISGTRCRIYFYPEQRAIVW